MIRIISFDLDGTLVDWAFEDAFWLDGLPRLYAERWGVSDEEAQRVVRSGFNEMGMDKLNWYDMRYWWKKYGLEDGSWSRLIEELRPKVRAYPESREVLEELCGKYRMMIATNGAKEMINAEIEQLNFGGYFDGVFSATSDFGVVKKSGAFFLDILKLVGATKEELVHVGDSWAFDYLAAREAGIRAFFVDREGKRSGDDVVRNLREFVQRL